MNVEPGDFIMLTPKSPESTGNEPIQVQVTKVECKVWVRYKDGSTSVYIMTPGELELSAVVKP